jgi:mono/diheme cytochrome c family protein
VSRRFSFAALAVLSFLAMPGLSFASSPAQAGGQDLLDNPALVMAIIAGGVLAVVVVGGIVISLIAALLSRFFGNSMPAADKWNAFNAAQAAAIDAERSRQRGPIRISPTAEPFIISIGGFLVVFALASMFVTVPAPKAETGNAGGAPAPSSGLPTKGDFTKIVSELPPGNADNGVKLYTSQACSGCHSLQKDQRLVGPSFYGLWSRAGTRIEGMGAKEYLYQSIVDPNVHVVEGYQSGLMPPTFAKTLKPQDMADLLAYIERDHNEK